MNGFLKQQRLVLAVKAVCPIVGISVPTIGVSATVQIQFDPAATPAQQTAAQNVVNAFVWSDAADLTAQAQRDKAAATAGIDNGSLQAGDKQDRIAVAVVGLVLDEFNLHAAKINAILTAVDGAATFAALKTAILAIPDYPTRTIAQLVTAVKAKIAATAE